ncbi:ATP-binding protein [Pediococcus damnosus]|uniref:ATP-binding protein n=1 Tax=Pediococcus damnosus TaxID=51663 RepID=UPI000704E362|nr:ATP-binding protein [Pediococcus damnosus]KRN50121.1 hypothetical protein IV84_GL001305 [Pediococcus damnosus]PJE50067.1 hypothetical protein BSQ36_09170 [Pediococcus damnosus]GEA93488.1 hypothetical protein PDA01_13810 [Pediococcus damnosus]
MLRPVDLKSIGVQGLNDEIFEEYQHYLGIKFRGREINDISSLVSDLPKNLNLSNFYIGYKIPQINKEFDLLRFCKNGDILNIELKSENIGKEKIGKQLIKNKYYLSAIPNYKKIDLFTYVSSDKKIYRLADSGKLIDSDTSQIVEYIEANSRRISNLDELFNPSAYLTSPFNSPQEFLNKAYFLTQQQTNVKKYIVRSLGGTFVVEGKAGTGKTLLAYDIARTEMCEGQKVLIVHCGNLNDGQLILNSKGWNIISIKSFQSKDINTLIARYNLIIIDEVQRVRRNYLSGLLTKVSNYKGKLIFCGDLEQYLQAMEGGKENFELLSNTHSISKNNYCKLSEKIRTNKEVASFILQFFDRKKYRNKNDVYIDNVFLQYFKLINDAILYSNVLAANGWKLITSTTSKYDPEYNDKFMKLKYANSHEVIGQEFDKVAVFVGPDFSYENGRLTGPKTYYSAIKTLFENMTRARKQLCLIIIDNPSVLKNCLEIVSNTD